jgi:hypothetical protein
VQYRSTIRGLRVDVLLMSTECYVRELLNVASGNSTTKLLIA